ncbi:MAG: hypothetical protein V7700_17065 [Halioglobus sp.]
MQANIRQWAGQLRGKKPSTEGGNQVTGQQGTPNNPQVTAIIAGYTLAMEEVTGSAITAKQRQQVETDCALFYIKGLRILRTVTSVQTLRRVGQDFYSHRHFIGLGFYSNFWSEPQQQLLADIADTFC